MVKHTTADAFRAAEDIEHAIGNVDEQDTEDEDAEAVFNYEARQTERRRAAKDKIQARVEN